jgi:hypothetical protein
VCLVFVDKVAAHHRAFADALRVQYGKVPTAGLPKISRLRKGQTRFHVFDSSGNVLLYIDREEPEPDYTWFLKERSRLGSAIDNAAFLRDIYVNDKAAALVLDKALAHKDAVDPIERARALAARAELAVAMGDVERARAVRLELQDISLSEKDRAGLRDELQAADELERWLTESRKRSR